MSPEETSDRYLDRLLSRIDELPAPAEGQEALESAALEDFEVLGELGRGGMGVVYVARQKSQNRFVALKFLPAHLAISPSSQERIRREAQAISRLHHPHLVRIHAAGEKDGAPFLAMEFVPGIPLSSLLEKLWGKNPRNLQGPDLHRAFQEAWNARFSRMESMTREFAPPPTGESPFWFQSYDRAFGVWARQIADALHAAHQCGVMHRDVKPSNILITAAGDAVLADFGLAWEGGAESMTQSEEFLGTLHYAAPEAILGKEGQRSPASDVYSLGMVLYESLTLHHPFEGRSRAQTVHRIATVEPDKVRKRNPSVDPSIEAICMKAIEKEPSWRYTSAREMASDLGRFFSGEPVNPSTIGEWSRSLRRIRRHPWTPWVFTATALLAGAVGVWLGTKNGPGFDKAHWEALPLMSESDRALADGTAAVLASSLTQNFKLFGWAKEKLLHDLEKNPDSPGTLGMLALAQQGAGDDSSRASCAKLLALFPQEMQIRQFVRELFPEVVATPGITTSKRALSASDRLLIELCLALRSKDFPQTQGILEVALEAQPDLVWPKLAYGFACILTVDPLQFSKAEKELTRYLQKAPDDALANTGLGFIYFNSSARSKEAGPFFERALAADPELWPAKDLLRKWQDLQK